MVTEFSAVVITSIPSPYQVELFDAVVGAGTVRLSAVYLARQSPDRLWLQPPMAHDYCVLENAQSIKEAEDRLAHADLVVFSDYGSGLLRRWMAERAATGRPWCFWGERPGLKHPGLLGQLYRRWRLRPLYRSGAPIWGMGRWAVERWRREFGPRRAYYNIPYFSELARFANPHAHARETRRFLYSGLLIPRKGVDLLAQAFARLAAQCPFVRLDLLGTGELESTLRQTLRGCTAQVRFLGFRPWPELPRFYHDADILCVPSRYDGWGMVVPEGLAAGLPVIATHATGAALDLLQSGDNGWLIPPDDESALYKAMYEAAMLPSAELGRKSAAAAACAANHSLATGVQRWVDAARMSILDSTFAFRNNPGGVSQCT